MIIKMKENDQFTIRELMPRGYTRIIEKKTRRKQSYITKVVTEEITGSPIWGAILELAEENKPRVIAERAKAAQEQERYAALKSKPAA